MTVHKILIHSIEVIKHALLPIGMLSEEAIKARQKQIRKYRECHARKMSNESNIQEVLHFILVSFDPVIFVQTPFRQKKKTLPLGVCLLMRFALEDLRKVAIVTVEVMMMMKLLLNLLCNSYITHTGCSSPM